MQEIVEVENFELYTCEELFYYLMDNLLISPDEDFRDWRHYKQDMLDICKNFDKECHERFGMEETE